MPEGMHVAVQATVLKLQVSKTAIQLGKDLFRESQPSASKSSSTTEFS